MCKTKGDLILDILENAVIYSILDPDYTLVRTLFGRDSRNYMRDVARYAKYRWNARGECHLCREEMEREYLDLYGHNDN